MINLAPKAKAAKKPKKKAQKLSTRVRTHADAARKNDGLTPEDIAEINMFSLAAAQSVVVAHKREQAAQKAKLKTKARRPA